jgi:hypothetical protein
MFLTYFTLIFNFFYIIKINPLYINNFIYKYNSYYIFIYILL